MEFLIYLVIPCVGSVFLLGSMFYAAYRMSGPESMFREEGKPAKKSIPGEEGNAERDDMSEEKSSAKRKNMSREDSSAKRRNMPREDSSAKRKNMPREKGNVKRKNVPWEESNVKRKNMTGETCNLKRRNLSWQRYLLRKRNASKQGDRFRRNGISGRALGIITAYILVCVAFSLLGNTWVNLAFLVLFPPAAWWAFETPKAYCLYYFILSAAVWLTDVASVMGLQIAMVEGLLYLNSPELQYILMVAVTRMAEFMVILLVALAAGHKTGRHITMRQVVISVLFPLYSIFNIYCLLYLLQIYPTRQMMLLFGVNLLLMIGLNLYFCVLVDVMSENYRLENERNLYRAQARMQHQYYEQEEEKYEASRKMIHDIRNHIQAMEALYARGICQEKCPEGLEDPRESAQREVEGEIRKSVQREVEGEIRESAQREVEGEIRKSVQREVEGEIRESAQREVGGEIRESVQRNARDNAQVDADAWEEARKDIQRAERYAGDIHRMLNSLQQKYYTSEKLLNIILNDKARSMQRLGVREDMKVGELSLDFMRETDVTALFANLLDNAVAAAARSKDGFVRLRVNRVRQFLSVTVENSCDAEPVKAAGTFRSRQAGHEGLGLKIIRQTVEQYGGDVQMDWKEGVFTVKVMLAAETAG